MPPPPTAFLLALYLITLRPAGGKCPPWLGSEKRNFLSDIQPACIIFRFLE